jgi:hypothetical protein
LASNGPIFVGSPITVVVLAVAPFKGAWKNVGVVIITVPTVCCTIISLGTAQTLDLGAVSKTIAINIQVVVLTPVGTLLISQPITVVILIVTDFPGLWRNLRIFVVTVPANCSAKSAIGGTQAPRLV